MLFAPEFVISLFVVVISTSVVLITSRIHQHRAVIVTSNLINLQSLIDLSAALNASDDDMFILNTSLLSVMGKLRTFRACALVPAASPLPESSLAAGVQAFHWQCATTKGLKMPDGAIVLQSNNYDAFDAALEPALIQAGVVMSQPVWTKDASAFTESEFAENPQCLALLCFGDKLDKTPYTDEERQYVSLVGSITANALMNAENMRSLREKTSFLDRKNQLLTTLFEINREFTTLLDKDEILKFLSLRLMGQLTVTKFALLMKNGHGTFDLTLNRLQVTTEQVVALNAAYQAQHEQYHNHADIALGTCSTLVPSCALMVPMKVQNETKGLLLVGGKMNRQPFRAEEENFLEALAGTAMTALENARLFHEEIEKKRLEEELNIARQIQNGLLPTELPSLDGFDLAAFSLSSKQIGGDYYDVIPISAANEEFMLVIADVSGKGTPAALLMANTQAALRVLTPLQLPMPEMVSRLNDMLFANTSSDKFVTFFAAKLNLLAKTLTFVNGGHNPPLLLHSDGTLDLLSEGGLVLGIMETIMPYEEKTVTLRAGDTVLMYTDGVSEALSPASEEFTEERTEASLRASAAEPAQAIVARMLADIETHVAGASQSDDITMIALKCLS